MNRSEIKKMTVAERLQAMEAIWDSLLYDKEEIKTPEWHQEILEDRKEKIKNGTAKFISLSELKAIHTK
jgi:putative addiction module component (TIGR02574 family)